MKPLSVSARVWLIFGLFALAMLVHAYLETTHTRKRIKSSYEGNVQQAVEIAKSILRHYYDQQRKGELTQDEAQRVALEVISEIRFGDGGYIFIGDRSGVAISNGIDELVGTNILTMQDPNGRYFVQELYAAAAKGGGFVSYLWPKPDDKSTLQTKTSFADHFPPWDWTLGSGLNITALKQDVRAVQYSSLLHLILIISAVGVILAFFVRGTNQHIRQLQTSMRDLANGHGDLKHRLIPGGGLELTEISASYNQLAASLEKMADKAQQDGQRFLAAAERMQPGTANPKFSSAKGLTLVSLNQMINEICHQAERLEQAHEALKEMAEQDPATGLLNPQAFEQQAREQLTALDSYTPNTLALIGIHSTLKGNTYDPTGSSLFSDPVATAASVLRHTLPAGALACYVPQKGFVYWHSYTDSSEGMRLAIMLQQQINQELPNELETSIGLSALFGGHKSYELLFSEAERALIRAQREGGNRVYEY